MITSGLLIICLVASFFWRLEWADSMQWPRFWTAPGGLLFCPTVLADIRAGAWPEPGWHLRRCRPSPGVWVPKYATQWLGTIAVIPFWVPLLGTLALTFFAARRHPNGGQATNCTQCGYNLTGNTSGHCPECGTGIERPAHIHASTSATESSSAADGVDV